MKKLTAILLVLTMVFAFAACGTTQPTESTPEATESTAPETTEGVDVLTTMTHDDFLAAEDYAAVCVEVYVQNTQSWWDDKISVYAQDDNGGYYIYNMVCSEEDAINLIPGTKIKVTGYKRNYNGLHEIDAGATFTFVEDAEPKIYEHQDVTELLGTEDLVQYQTTAVSFKGMTIVGQTDAAGEEVAFLYGWDGSGEAGSDSDLYFDASINGQTYTFVIEYYLCDENSAPYQAVQNLSVGDVVDMEGYLYWYEGPQAHITSVNIAE